MQWGESIMAIEPSAMQGFDRPRRRGPMADALGCSVEWDEYGMARAGSVALIAIEGTLSRVGGWFSMGYDQILECHDRAFRSDAKAVLQVTHSPGGYISGMDECGLAIEALALQYPDKPLHCLAADMAYSAALRIACPAARIDVTRAGGVGSVGIATTRADYTKANEMMGFRFVQIVSGLFKTDGDPDVAITEGEIARAMERIQYHFSLFGGAVAKSRGLSIDDVRAQQAGLFLGPQAVAAKMADGVSTLKECVARLESMTAGKPMVAIPATVGPRGQTAKVNSNMENAMLAIALGLSPEAKDQEIQGRLQALVALEGRLNKETGQTSIDEAFGVVGAWKMDHDKIAAAQSELMNLRAKDAEREYSALFSNGEAQGKITPANAGLVREKHKSPAALAAFLETALVGIPGAANAGVKPAIKKEDGADSKALTWNGKTWAQLKPMEQAALAKEDKGLYGEMRSAALKGDSK